MNVSILLLISVSYSSSPLLDSNSLILHWYNILFFSHIIYLIYFSHMHILALFSHILFYGLPRSCFAFGLKFLIFRIILYPFCADILFASFWLLISSYFLTSVFQILSVVLHQLTATLTFTYIDDAICKWKFKVNTVILQKAIIIKFTILHWWQA